VAHNVGSGDRLARGAVSATFTVRDEVSISQKKWNAMFEDFDLETFLEEKPKVEGPKEETKTGIVR
jgi:hypothetical protein